MEDEWHTERESKGVPTCCSRCTVSKLSNCDVYEKLSKGQESHFIVKDPELLARETCESEGHSKLELDEKKAEELDIEVRNNADFADVDRCEFTNSNESEGGK